MIGKQPKRPIRQIAYAVTDLHAAAKAHAAINGSGPFFFAEHIPVHNAFYRGKPTEIDHSIIFGQWGEIMVEFFIQHNSAPSHVHDMFPFGSGLSGMHHVAHIVEDLPAAIADFKAAGFEVASSFTVGTSDGYDVVMIDTRAANGHMVELYPAVPPLLAAYQLSYDAAANPEGRELITKISF
jgi:hypothetical protein